MCTTCFSHKIFRCRFVRFAVSVLKYRKIQFSPPSREEQVRFWPTLLLSRNAALRTALGMGLIRERAFIVAIPSTEGWGTILERGRSRQVATLSTCHINGFLTFESQNNIANNMNNVKGEIINMTRAWDREKSESPIGIEPMTSRTPGERSIH